jgi:hypothetical protein
VSDYWILEVLFQMFLVSLASCAWVLCLALNLRTCSDCLRARFAIRFRSFLLALLAARTAAAGAILELNSFPSSCCTVATYQ